MKRQLLACAHRGLSAEQPENTITAFRAAAQAGAQAIELDVRTTHDGHVVVMHDANLARTTDASGRVGDLDLKELQTHVTSDGAPVPTLDDVFAALADWDGVWNVEVKTNAATPGVLDLMRAHGLDERLIVTSMDPDALMVVHKSSPRTPRGLIVMGPPDQDDFDVAEKTGCSWFMADHENIDVALVQSCLQEGMNVGAWTVNDVDAAKRLVGMGVHMVMTDERDVLEALL